MDVQHIACSSDKRDLVDPLIKHLNDSGPWQFEPHYYSDEDLIRYVVGRDFGLLCPTSDLSLRTLEDQWEQHRGAIKGSIFARQTSFGVTPVVFFMSPRTAKRLKVFEEPLGWNSLARLARDQAIRIRHAALRASDGVAVAVAQHLSLQSHTESRETPLEEIKLLERAVDEYGPDDEGVLQRAVVEGDWTTDIVIAQEKSIIAGARSAPGNKGVIVYPHDGTLVIGNSVASMSGWQSPQLEEAFERFTKPLLGLKPATLARNALLHKDAGALGSSEALQEFTSALGPKVGETLQWAAHSGVSSLVLPGRQAIRGIRSLVSTAKRAVDVCLLFDSSSSMQESGKFPEAKAAVDEFVQLLQGPGSRACLIRFQTQAIVLTPLRPPTSPFYQPGSLNPAGDTALYDAVSLGVDTLETTGDPAHIWAIIAFTDGRENASSTSVAALEQRLRQNSALRFYGVAYGADADDSALSRLAGASGGMVLRGDPGTIRSLYERLSTYV
jgi:Mg-chelatase subunit ChlD